MILAELTKAQLARMKWAVDLTVEHLALCQVPPPKRVPIIRELVGELLRAFAKGEQYPNVPTEDYWRERALKEQR